jgi:hypothetical protein
VGFRNVWSLPYFCVLFVVISLSHLDIFFKDCVAFGTETHYKNLKLEFQ